MRFGPGRGTLSVGGQVVAEFRILSMEIEAHTPEPTPSVGIRVTMGRSALVRPSKPPAVPKGTVRRTAQWKRETKGYRP